MIVFLPFTWKGRGAVALAATAIAGWLWTWGHAALVLKTGLDQGLEGKDVVVEGRVSDLPVLMQRGQRFVFDVAQLHDGRGWRPFPVRIYLSWYETGPRVRLGEGWRFTVRLKRPAGFANPGGFDYEGWLFQRRIRATGYVRTDTGNRQLGIASFNPIPRWRQQLAERLDRVLAERPAGGLIRALAIGDRSVINPAQWDTLRNTGTNHLVAISGLHVGLLAGLAFFATRCVWHLAGLLRYLPAGKPAALMSILAAACYAALAGFSLPTQRAFLMVTVASLGILLGHRTVPSRMLAIALWAVVLWNPAAVRSLGLPLSFAAVAVIIYLCHGRSGRQPLLWRWSRLQIGLLVGLAPLLSMTVQQVNLVSPLANLVAIPWVGLLVVPVTLLGCALLTVSPPAGEVCLRAAARLLELLWPVLELLAQVPGSQWRQAASGWPQLVFAAAGIFWLLAPRGWPARWIGAVLALPMMLARGPVPGPGAAWITLLDVGQGLAAVVRTTRHTLVFDTGPRFGPRLDAGSAVIVPFLNHQGVRAVDRLIISHDDIDHAGGMKGLMHAIRVEEIFAGLPESINGAEAQPCAAGQVWLWDGVRFQIMHPPAGHGERGNDASCVLRIDSGGGHSMLIPGDIEKKTELQLVRTRGQDLQSDFLVAPHHGSSSSSTAVFLDRVRPGYVLFPVGYRNRWGFPRPQVQARYRKLGTKMMDTARSGALLVRLPGHGKIPAPESYRSRSAHYWNRAVR